MSELLHDLEWVSENFNYVLRQILNDTYVNTRYISSDFANHTFSGDIPAMASSYGMFNLMEFEKLEHISMFSKRGGYKTEMKRINMSVESICQAQGMIRQAINFFYKTQLARFIGVDEREIIGIKKENISEAAARFLQPMQYSYGDVVIDRTLQDYSFKRREYEYNIERNKEELGKLIESIDKFLGPDWDIAYFFFTPYHDLCNVTGFITFIFPDELSKKINDYIADFENFLAYILTEIDKATITAQNVYKRNMLYDSKWNDAWYKIQQRVNDHNQGAHVLARLAFSLPKCEEGKEETHEGLSKIYFQYIRTRQSYLLALLNKFHISGKISIKNTIDKFIRNKYSTHYISGVENLVPQIHLELPEDKDVWVAIPNGEIGVHAIYNILENIVRNTAKHSKNVVKDKFDFTITIKEGIELLPKVSTAPGLYNFKLRISHSERDMERYYDEYPPTYLDNTALLSDIAEKEEELNNILSSMYAIIIREHTEYKVKGFFDILDSINTMLSMPILDTKTFKLRESGWGLIEMKTAAAYLRNIPKEIIDHYIYAPYYRLDINDRWKDISVPILQAIPHKLENGNYNLSYMFFVSKLQYALIITPNKELLDELQKPEYRNQGLYAISEEDIRFSQTYNHEIVIIDNTISSEMKEKIKVHSNLFSRKLIYISSDCIKSGIIDKFTHKDNKHTLETLASVLYYNNQQENKFPISLPRSIQKVCGIKKGVISNMKVAVLDHGEGIQFTGIKEDVVSEVKVDDLNHGERIETTKKKDLFDFIEVKHSLTEKYFQNKLNYFYTLPIKVVVLDERVQEATEKQTYKPIGEDPVTYKELYKFTNIQVPDQEEINYSVSNYSKECLDETIKYLDNHKDAYFFLFHIEIIEKLIYAYNSTADNKYSLDSKGIESFLKNILFEGNDSALFKVIILSGKGIPTNIPKSVRFIHLSTIAEVIVGQERNKYAFTEVLFSARGVIS